MRSRDWPRFQVPRWRKLQLAEIGNYFGTRVSDLLEMEDAGYGPEARLAVDDDYSAFAKRFHRMLEATKLVDIDAPEAPPRPKKGEKPQVQVAAYTEDQLFAELDLTPGDRSSGVVAGAIASRPLRDADWDAVDLWNDDGS